MSAGPPLTGGGRFRHSFIRVARLPESQSRDKQAYQSRREFGWAFALNWRVIGHPEVTLRPPGPRKDRA